MDINHMLYYPAEALEEKFERRCHYGSLSQIVFDNAACRQGKTV